MALPSSSQARVLSAASCTGLPGLPHTGGATQLGTAGAHSSAMSPFRLAALLPLLAGGGCYRDAAPQSTWSEPHYVSGPPGGAIDPGSTYVQDGEPGAVGAPGGAAATDDTDDPDEDVAGDAGVGAPPAPIDPTGPTGPAEEDPRPAGAVGVPTPGARHAPLDGTSEISVAAADPAAAPRDAAGDPAAEAGDPTRSVTNAEIDATLDGYGQWIDTDDYGEVWSPDATVVGVDFTPYETGGSWIYTDAGWAFGCAYPWGWLPFHYGRWAWLHGRWAWVPGHRWGPAWVHWRHGGGVIGWRPIPPRVRDPRHHGSGFHHSGGTLVRDHRRAEQHDAHWRFAAVSDFGRPHVRSHLYGNLAEGLRLTARVKAPPIQARARVRAADLMRDRVAGARFSRPGQPGSSRPAGPALVHDHRGAEPVRSDPPTVRTPRPQHAAPGALPPTYRPPMQQPPVRTYQPPVWTYQPPVRTYQPPVRTYQPPVRTVQPHAPPPSRSWSPPHTSSPPSSGGGHASGGGSHASGGGSHASGGGSHASGGGSHASGGGSHASSSGGSHSSSGGSHASGSSSHASGSSSHASGGGHHR
jgi:hypothetical protein